MLCIRFISPRCRFRRLYILHVIFTLILSWINTVHLFLYRDSLQIHTNAERISRSSFYEPLLIRNVWIDLFTVAVCSRRDLLEISESLHEEEWRHQGEKGSSIFDWCGRWGRHKEKDDGQLKTQRWAFYALSLTHYLVFWCQIDNVWRTLAYQEVRMRPWTLRTK